MAKRKKKIKKKKRKKIKASKSNDLIFKVPSKWSKSAYVDKKQY